MSPLIFVTVGVILVFTPLSVWATWFLWGLYREAEIPEPVPEPTTTAEEAQPTGLKLAVFAMSAASTVAGVLLAIPTVVFIAGVRWELGGLLVLVAIDILLPASVGVAGYLRWLRR